MTVSTISYKRRPGDGSVSNHLCDFAKIHSGMGYEWTKILVQSSLKLKGTHKYQVLSYPNTFTLMTWDWFVMFLFWPWFLCHQWTCFCDVASITYVVCIVHSSQIILYEPRSMGLSVHLHTVFRNFGCLQFGQAKHKVDVTWTCKIWRTERLSCLCISWK